MAIGIIFVMMTGFMWAVEGLFITPSYFEHNFYSTISIVFLVHLIGLIVLTILFYKNLSKYFKSYSKHFILITSASLLSIIGTLSIVKALSLTNYEGFSIVAIIQQMQPIVASFFAIVILKERPTKEYPLILILSIILVYTMQFGLKNPLSVSINDYYVVIYSIIAVICYGASTVFSKNVTNKVDFKVQLYFRYFVPVIFLAPIIIFFKRSDISFVISNKSVVYIGILNAFWGLIAIYIYLQGVIRIKALQITMAELMYPVSTVVLNLIIYKTYFNKITIISIILFVLISTYFQISKIKDNI